MNIIIGSPKVRVIEVETTSILIKEDKMEFVIIALLIIFSFDFTKLRKQNETMIEQNERIISLMEEISNKKS